MSLTTEITNLTSQVTQLTQRVDQWVDDADAALQAAINAVPSMMVGLYVDPATGDDAAAGSTPATALATLDRALELAAPIRWTTIVLMGDVTCSGTRQMWGNKIFIRSDNPSARRRIDIGNDFNGVLWNAFLRFQDVHLVLPSDAPTGHIVFWPAGYGSIVFRDCSIEYVAGDVCLAARGYGGLSLSGYGITAINMAGHWLREAPAGTDIDSVPGVISSIANI